MGGYGAVALYATEREREEGGWRGEGMERGMEREVNGKRTGEGLRDRQTETKRKEGGDGGGGEGRRERGGRGGGTERGGGPGCLFNLLPVMTGRDGDRGHGDGRKL